MENTEKKNVDSILAKSFKQLAVKKPIEKITIKEITDLTGVIRPTFYNHFQDKYDLLEWIVKIEIVTPCRDDIIEGNYKEAITGMLERMRAEKDFYESCARLEGQNSFSQTLSDAIRDMMLSFVDEAELTEKLWYKWLTPRLVADFFAKAITDSIVTWIRGGMQIAEDEIWECFAYLANHSILEMLLGMQAPWGDF